MSEQEQANGNGESSRPAAVLRFASLVKKAREKRGWSQTTLAETAHVRHDVIQRLESGMSDPPLSLVADLTRILELNVLNAIYNQQVAKQVAERREEITS